MNVVSFRKTELEHESLKNRIFVVQFSILNFMFYVEVFSDIDNMFFKWFLKAIELSGFLYLKAHKTSNLVGYMKSRKKVKCILALNNIFPLTEWLTSFIIFLLTYPEPLIARTENQSTLFICSSIPHKI